MNNQDKALIKLVANLKPMITVDDQWRKCAMSLYQHPEIAESLIVVSIPYGSTIDPNAALADKSEYAGYLSTQYETGKSHFIIK